MWANIISNSGQTSVDYYIVFPLPLYLVPVKPRLRKWAEGVSVGYTDTIFIFLFLLTPIMVINNCYLTMTPINIIISNYVIWLVYYVLLLETKIRCWRLSISLFSILDQIPIVLYISFSQFSYTLNHSIKFKKFNNHIIFTFSISSITCKTNVTNSLIALLIILSINIRIQN